MCQAKEFRLHIAGHGELKRFLCNGDGHDLFGLGRSLCSNVRTDEMRKKLVTGVPVRS